MAIRRTKKHSATLFVFATIFAAIFFDSIGFAANFPLEIIQPVSGLNTANRFYKAYPGLLYEVNVAVIGGAYPFTYSLTTAPIGMTIDNTGTISWTNPTTSGSPHSITVRVLDSEGTSATVTWTITVTTTGFYFIDSVNGRTVANGGTGTIGNPWKVNRDWYLNNKNDSTYSGGFLYYRTGTYYADHLDTVEDGWRIPFRNVKPLVWLAYPGDHPVFDLSRAHIAPYGGAQSNFYVDGIEFGSVYTGGIGLFMFRVDSNANDMTFRKNTLHDIPYQAGSNNTSFYMIAAGGSIGQRWAFIGNKMYNGVHAYGILGYSTNKVARRRKYLLYLQRSSRRRQFPRYWSEIQQSAVGYTEQLFI